MPACEYTIFTHMDHHHDNPSVWKNLGLPQVYNNSAQIVPNYIGEGSANAPERFPEFWGATEGDRKEQARVQGLVSRVPSLTVLLRPAPGVSIPPALPHYFESRSSSELQGPLSRAAAPSGLSGTLKEPSEEARTCQGQQIAGGEEVEHRVDAGAEEGQSRRSSSRRLARPAEPRQGPFGRRQRGHGLQNIDRVVGRPEQAEGEHDGAHQPAHPRAVPPGAPAGAPQPRQRHAVAAEHQPEGKHEGRQSLEAQVRGGVGRRRVAQLAQVVPPEVAVDGGRHGEQQRGKPDGEQQAAGQGRTAQPRCQEGARDGQAALQAEQAGEQDAGVHAERAHVVHGLAARLAQRPGLPRQEGHEERREQQHRAVGQRQVQHERGRQRSPPCGPPARQAPHHKAVAGQPQQCRQQKEGRACAPAQQRTTQPRTLLHLPATMEYLSALNPSGLLRSVSNMSSEFGRRVWTSAPPPQRPFRVCDHKRTTRKGLTAATRQELLDKALETLLLSGVLTLVLEEDGTAVESEDFFQLLEDDTCLMSGVLSYGLGREKPKHSKDIARITFDVYKQNPRDLFGSLNIKATFYGLYSMSCDIQGLGPKKVLRELLRWISALLQGLGHILLGISSTLRHVVEGAEQWQLQRQGRLHRY
ncbi:cell death activator CIDE-B isoform X2 [Equus quagga]|nr:cell death activator CIDE-B isoform X2 [Equus quagga]